LPLIVIHNFFHRLVDTALGHTCRRERAATSALALDSTFELAMLEEIAWTEIASSRVRRVLTWAADPHLKSKLVRFAILNEPIRILHRIFIRYSSQGTWRVADRPALLDFTSKRYSPVLAVEQYCGSVLLPRSRRRALLTEGCSWLRWKLGVPDASTVPQAMEFRFGLLLVASWSVKSRGSQRAWWTTVSIAWSASVW
jgi:hypothetical protein